MNTKPNALDAYLASTAAIHAKLAQLQQPAGTPRGAGISGKKKGPETI